ncbi:MAG: major capsid protein [Proteobacteria bacterium]|nr:major capsid protein [Pseudomonadota bacterium]
MSDRLKQLRVVDPVLTEIARGYHNAAFISEALFPVVPVDKEGVIVPLFGKEAFRLWDTERAIRAASNVMTPDDINNLDVVLREHDLAYPCDYREENESMFDIESRAAIRVKDSIDLKREWGAAQLAQNPDNYLSGAKVALAGSDSWKNGGGDPVGVVEEAKEVLRSRIGVRPNTVVMGAATYAALKFHPKLQEALGGNERKLITLEHLRFLFGIDSIHIGEALAGDTATGDIWGDNLILAYVARSGAGRSASYDEPSFGYTLRRKGMPETDRYDSEGGKVRYVRHTDIYKAVIVGADAGYLVSGVAS